jgi:outer membrane protein assembly factor BamB
MYEAGARLFGSPSLDGTTVLVLDDADMLHRLDLATGAGLTRTALTTQPAARQLPAQGGGGWDFRSATPVVRDGLIYVGTSDGRVHALHASDVRPLWSTPLRGPVRAACWVDDDLVVAGDRAGTVSALHRLDGTVVWTRDFGAPITTTPAGTGDLVIVGGRDCFLRALDRRTGATRWERYYFASWVESTPLLAPGEGYIGSSDLRTVRAFDPQSGRVRWQFDVRGWAWGTPALGGGRLYVATAAAAPYAEPLASALWALDARSGAPIWRVSAPHAAPGRYVHGFTASPLFATDRVIVTSVDGSIAAHQL